MIIEVTQGMGQEYSKMTIECKLRPNPGRVNVAAASETSGKKVEEHIKNDPVITEKEKERCVRECNGHAAFWRRMVNLMSFFILCGFHQNQIIE